VGSSAPRFTAASSTGPAPLAGRPGPQTRVVLVLPSRPRGAAATTLLRLVACSRGRPRAVVGSPNLAPIRLPTRCRRGAPRCAALVQLSAMLPGALSVPLGCCRSATHSRRSLAPAFVAPAGSTLCSARQPPDRSGSLMHSGPVRYSAISHGGTRSEQAPLCARACAPRPSDPGFTRDDPCSRPHCSQDGAHRWKSRIVS
jgi:hypothetical protein